MSSILDALNKLEEEKAAANEPLDIVLDEDLVERDLVGGGRAGRDAGAPALPWSPWAVVAFMAVFVCVLVVASAGTALWVLRARMPELPPAPTAAPVESASAQPLAAPTPTETPTASTDIADPAAAVTPDPVAAPVPPAAVPPDPVPAPVSPAAVAPPPTPQPQAPVAPQMSPPPVTPPPVSEVVAVAPPVVSEVPSPPPPPVAAEPPPPRLTAPAPVLDSGEIDLQSLPMLTESDRIRLRLPEITINVVGRPNPNRPVPSALINYRRVTLNERIEGSDAILIAVDVHGIGIEVRGERYFVPKRR